jgi:subtilisin family serine protease
MPINKINYYIFNNRPSLLNYRARSIPQSSQVGSQSSNCPYSSAGLLGENQIATIADTGLDSFSCYFYDPQGQIPPTDVAAPKYDLKYRKVIQYNYNGCGGPNDAQGGHGTHVSGIVAGSISGANLFSGKYFEIANDFLSTNIHQMVNMMGWHQMPRFPYLVLADLVQDSVFLQ